MNLEYKQLLPEDFHPDSRVWIYQSSRLFFISEALQIEELLEAFIANWDSHGKKVKGYANLLFGTFIVIIADRSVTEVSGCSTDASVRVIKEIEKLFKVDLFNRTNLAFYVKEKIQMLPLSQLNYALENQFINPETMYFNNTLETKQEMEENWIIPLKDSWLKSKIKSTDITN